ncbi:MAG: hypothetical protein EOP06_04075 [Proteobacteria bacterium]|nr:MAG: hypothetical protein EOP06_04075 [Pseudomonadota bacterium]
MKYAVMVSMLVLMSLSTASAAGRYTYDVQKFEAILASEDVENALKLSTLDGIILKSSDDVKQLLVYELKTNNSTCSLEVMLSWSSGWSPDYKVTSVGTIVCP